MVTLMVNVAIMVTRNGGVCRGDGGGRGGSKGRRKRKKK